MSIMEIFEKVNLVMPIEQRRFFNYFEDSVNELEALYSGFVFEEGAEYTPPSVLSDEKIVVRPLFHNAIVDNILFLAGGGETYKTEFLRKSRDAWLKYWNDKAKGRKLRKKW